MAFDLASARPASPQKCGFDLASARPAQSVRASDMIPGASPEQLASARRGQAAPQPEDNLLGKVVSPIDAGLGMLSGIVSPVLAVPAGFVQSAFNDKSPEQNAVAIRDRLQYQPATVTGRRILETIGEAAPVLEALPGMAGELSQLGQAARIGTGSLRELAAPGAAIQNAADDAARAGGGRIRDLVRKPQEPTLAGVGAARSPEATVRQQRAANLGLAPLTEGQATRAPAQVRFEREVMKKPEGEPLVNRVNQHNQQILGKFDEFREATGAQAPTLRATGGVVNDALVKEYNAARREVGAAYRNAEAAGEMAEPVSYQGLADYLEQNSVKIDAGNVPMMKYVRDQIAKFDPQGSGKVTINQLEEIRKGAGQLTEPGSANSAFIGPIKSQIDAAMEGASGQLYQQARQLNRQMANRFENVGVVDKLLRTKRGTNDRIVALDDVADHVLNGSLDDVRHVRTILQSGGKEQGAQAWREIQGAGLDRLRDALFPEHGTQGTSNVLPRPSAFKKAVVDLDSDGRLEAIYGKRGAQQIRDLSDAAIDVNYSAGANTSNTASAFEDFANQKLNSVLRMLPGGGTAAEYLANRAQSKALTKRVNQSLEGQR